MKTITQSVRQFLVSEDGPTAVEYAVMLALIIVVSITAISNLGTLISGKFASVSTSMAS